MVNSEPLLRVAGVLQESVVDGPGLRAVVFFQGCPHHCRGCHNPATWDPEGGDLLSVSEVWDLLQYNPLLTGVTFSGGEPLAQPKAALALAQKARAVGGDLMIYSGYRWEEIIALQSQEISELLTLTSLLVDGRFMIKQKKEKLLFRGSENQRIIDVQTSLEKKTPVLWKKNGG